MTMSSSSAFDPDDLKDKFGAAYESELQNLGRFNLAIFGKTGVGKSTLINAIFRENVAETGNSRPVTTETRYYHRDGVPLGIYDSRGWEMGETGQQVLDQFHALVKEKKDAPVAEQLHVVWYCVRAADKRFEDRQAEFVRVLVAQGLPVMLVLTQVPQNAAGELHPDAIALADDIASRNLGIAPHGRPHLTMALADEWGAHPAHGLDELLRATLEAAPEGARQALINSQQISLELKLEAARAAIRLATAAAAATGAVPIPVADAAVLVPIQITMMAKIAAVYGLSTNTGKLATLVGAVFASTGVTQAGKYLVRTMLKAVPGYGTIASGVIQAGVASTMTWSVGEAWAVVCRELFKRGDDLTALPTEELRAMFLEEFKRRAAIGRRGASS